MLRGEAGIRTLGLRASNPLMARDFWRQRSWGQSVARSLPFAAVTPSSLDSTRVVETLWQRPSRRGPMSLSNRGCDVVRCCTEGKEGAEEQVRGHARIGRFELGHP
jgi:hypothetical protein